MNDGPILIERGSQADALIQRLETDAPVLIVSSRSDGTWGVDPQLVHDRLGGLTDVVALGSAGVSRQVQRRLESARLGAYDTYGGALRAVAPGGATDLFLCFDSDDPLLVVGKVRAWVERHVPQREPSREEMLSRQVAELTAERDDLAERLQEALKDHPEVEEPTEPQVPVVFDDPVEQLRHEVWLAWLASAPQSRRGEMAEYLIGPDFITDLSMDLIDRPRVITVMVEVLRDVVWDLHARGVHQMRESEHGGSPTRVRTDGAAAWRAAIKRNSPGAPRLMWWVLPDGTIEFARATHHDDTRMR